MQGREIKGVSRAAADVLFSYSWPGNLRELDRVILAAVALTNGDVIEEGVVLVSDLPGPARSGVAAPSASRPDEETGLTLAAVERLHVERVLASVGGNKTRAALTLGISRSRLQRHLGTARSGAGTVR